MFTQFQKVEQQIEDLPSPDTSDPDFASKLEGVFTSVFGQAPAPFDLGSLGDLSQLPVLVISEDVPDPTFDAETVLQTGTSATSSAFNLDLDNFLKHTTTGSFSVTANLDYLFKFSFDPVTSTAKLDTTTKLSDDSAIKPAPGSTLAIPATPMAVIVSAGPTQGFSATCVLAGLLQAKVTDKGTNISAIVGIGFDPTTDDVTATLSADAGLTPSFAGDLDVPLNPTLSTEVKFGWSLKNIDLGSTDFNLLTPPPNNRISGFTFGDVSFQLNVGVFSQIINTIQGFTKPLRPFIDFLDSPVPGLSTLGLHVNVLDLIGGIGIALGGLDSGELDDINDAFKLVTAIDDLNIPADGLLSSPDIIKGFAINDPRQGADLSVVPDSIVTGLSKDDANADVESDPATSWLDPIDGTTRMTVTSARPSRSSRSRSSMTRRRSPTYESGRTSSSSISSYRR